MRKTTAVLALALLALVATPTSALGRSGVPLVDYTNQAIVLPTGRSVTETQVRDAVIRAATSLGWSLNPFSENTFVATLVVRNKHSISVNVMFSPTKYSVTYNNSANMKYDIAKGVPVIHPNYNEWTKKLVDAIRAEILKAAEGGVPTPDPKPAQ